DPFSEEAIKAANPAFDDFLNADEIRGQAAQAKRMPALEPLFRNFVLNQRVEASSPFVNQTVWAANGAAPIEGNVVYGGLDLSATNDLTSLVLVSPAAGRLSVHPVFWLPEENLAER